MKMLLMLLGLLSVYAVDTAAQTYPTRPVRFVLPFAPGGSTDALLRVLTPKLSEALGQTVIIDNRPGAGGNLAADIVAKSTPDGYTILVSSAMLTTNKSLYSKLSYDPEKDFAPVTHLGGGPYVLVVHPSLPAKSVQELIALAKAKPLNYASSGIGGASHLAGELFKMRTGVQMTHVPYKGGGPAAIAVMSNETPILFGTIASSLGHVKSGRLRGLAVSSLQRSTFVPDLPSVAEAGVKGYNVTTWDGLSAPAATPKAVIAKLHGETVKLLRAPDMRDAVRGMGYEPTGMTPEEFGQFLREETALWSKVIREAKIRAD